MLRIESKDIISLEIKSSENRNLISMALAVEGFPVWIKKSGEIMDSKYFVCFVNVNFDEKEISWQPPTR